MDNLPTTTPAEVLDISPEALEVANCYLQLQDIRKVSEELDMPEHIIASLLGRREVKAYVDNVFMNLGFNNQFQMRNLMDALIKKKLQEMDEAGIGSAKDITELLALSHKMTMEQMDKQIKLAEVQKKNGPQSQVNVQINEAGNNYASLVDRLLKGNV